MKAFLACLLIALVSLVPACTGGSGSSDDYFAPGYQITPPEIVATPDSRGQLAPMDSYAFGEVSATASATITLNNVGELAASITNISFGNSAFSFAGGTFPGVGGNCSRSIPAKGSCAIAVSFTPTAGASISATLSVVYRSREGEKTLSVLLTGSGTSQPETGTVAFSAPVITSIDFSGGPLAGGTSIKLTGTGFRSGAVVKFGGTACTNLTVDSENRISCTTPAHAAGAVDVVVTNSDNKTGTLASGFSYQAAPAVVSVSPNVGPLAGGTFVTIAGTGFLSGAVVDFSGSDCTGVTVVSSAEITCTTSAHAVGAVSVRVTNPDLQFGLGPVPAAYTYQAAPTVISLSPNVGPVAGGTSVTITGSGFRNNALVSVGGSSCANVVVVNSTTVTCDVPAHAAGEVSVTVTNSDSQSGSVNPGFTYQPPPTVTSISPSAGGIAGGTTVTITGTDFLADASVAIGGSVCSSVNVSSATQLSCLTSAHVAGTVAVTVTNSDLQSGSLSSGYTYASGPKITSVSPAVGSVDGGTWLWLTGTGFVDLATVTVGGLPCDGVTVFPPTGIICTTRAHAAGDVDVVVTNPDGITGTAYAGYNYRPAPTISSVSPNSADLNATTALTITGTNFYSGASVSVGSLICASVVVTSSTVLTCALPPGDGGVMDVSVNNTDGQSGRLNGGFTHTGGGSWSSVSSSGAPVTGWTNVGVWTGAKLIVWGGTGGGGGYSNAGGIYDPITDVWTATTTTNAPQGRMLASGVWTGSKLIVWGGQTASGVHTNTGGVYDLLTDTWTATNLAGAPDARSYHDAIWTGAKMIVWGGTSGGIVRKNTGAMYDPITNAWLSTSTVGAPSARMAPLMVWTGSRMLVWGGISTIYETDGGQYDPVQNSWTSITSNNAPSGRWETKTIWTGSRMIVWGGQNGNNFYNTGGVYNPYNDSWMTMTTTGAPSQRGNHSMIWTGSKMIVWGGVTTSPFNDGRLYDPNQNSWSRVTTVNAATARSRHIAVWSGSKMLVFGPDTTGGTYTPPADAAADTWVATTNTGAPSIRQDHTAIWTGSKMAIWGGMDCSAGCGSGNDTNTGALYDPVADSWTAMSTTGAAESHSNHTAVWTGSKMIVWGGLHLGSYSNTGGKYDPVLNSWTSLSTTGAPSARYRHTAVWTGAKMIAWGGQYSGTWYNDGAQYDPDADTWSTISSTNAPTARSLHTAVWTGSAMLIWGGMDSGSPANTGGTYNPVADSWTSITTSGAPTAVYAHTAVWTGSKMIVWGGIASGNASVDTGGQYDPIGNSWTATAIWAAPRAYHTAIWTGSKMITFGGNSPGNSYETDLYDPIANSWSAGTNTNNPGYRTNHTAVWTGSKMIVWGGTDGANLSTGGVYTP